MNISRVTLSPASGHRAQNIILGSTHMYGFFGITRSGRQGRLRAVSRLVRAGATGNGNCQRARRLRGSVAWSGDPAEIERCETERETSERPRPGAGGACSDLPNPANTLCPLCVHVHLNTAFFYNSRRQRSLVLPPAFSRGPGDQASNGGDHSQDEAAVADDDDRHEVLHVAA